MNRFSVTAHRPNFDSVDTGSGYVTGIRVLARIIWDTAGECLFLLLIVVKCPAVSMTWCPRAELRLSRLFHKDLLIRELRSEPEKCVLRSGRQILSK